MSFGGINPVSCYASEGHGVSSELMIIFFFFPRLLYVFKRGLFFDEKTVAPKYQLNFTDTRQNSSCDIPDHFLKYVIIYTACRKSRGGLVFITVLILARLVAQVGNDCGLH